MNVKDLLLSCDENLIIEKLIEIYKLEKIDEYKLLIKNLKELEANENKTNFYVYLRLENFDEGMEFHVFGRDDNSDIYNYNISAMKHENILSLYVDEKNLFSFDKEIFMACVIWEMTWFGTENNSHDVVIKRLGLDEVEEGDE